MPQNSRLYAICPTKNPGVWKNPQDYQYGRFLKDGEIVVLQGNNFDYLQSEKTGYIVILLVS